MYTIILYWHGEEPEDAAFDPECYGFLFSYAHMQGQVLRRRYAGPGTLRHTIEALNRAVGDRAEWRLILFDGRLSTPGRDAQSCLPPPDTVRREWTPLLLCVSGEETEGGRLEAVSPQEVWYLNCSVQGAYTCIGQSELAYAKLLLTEAEHSRLCGETGRPGEIPEETPAPYRALDVANIPSLRLCWTEILPEGGVCRRQEAFRLCCILLTLAHNDISPSILNSGYVYRVSIELDWERLARSVDMLRRQSADLAEQFQRAREYCRWMQRRTTPYVKPANLYTVRSGPPVRPEDMQARKLDRKELNRGGESALNRKLRSTHQWLYKQLFFPQDGVYESLSRPVKLEERNSDIALDLAGQASVQSELNYAIQDFFQRRKRENSPLRFEQELTGVERRVRDRMEDRLTDAERRPVQKILAVLEGMTFAAFVMHPLDKLTQFLAQRFPSFFSAVERRFTWSGWPYIWKFLLFLIAAAAVYALTRLMFWVVARFADWWAVSRYNKYLNNALKHRGKKRKSTLAFMEYILRYRYHWTLKKRQVEIAADKKRQKECLRRHSAAQKSTAAACDLLGQLLGEERCAGMTSQGTPAPRIDFSQEPEQEDYFWHAVRNQTCSLNGSGYELDVVFDFITEVEIHKSAALRDLSNSCG